jgi:hypothetical protein
MNIALWPLIARDRLVRAYRPGEPSLSEAPFRTLRRHSWSTAGVRITPRTVGRATGRCTVFSTLNLEAARLARLHANDNASRLARAAAALESGPAFLQLEKLLADLPAETIVALVEGTFPADASTELWRTLQVLAQETRRRWITESRRGALSEMVVGCIAEMSATTVVLKCPNSPDLTLPRWLARAAHREAVGACLAVVTEQLEDSSALAYAIPALDLDAAPPQFSPFGRARALREITEADLALLTGSPKPLRVIVPVTIGA